MHWEEIYLNQSIRGFLIKNSQLEASFFEKLQHGDTVLANTGLTIEEELATYGATLTIPHFTGGKSQMSAKEV